MQFKDEAKFMEIIPPEIKPIRIPLSKGTVIIHRPCFEDYRGFESDFASLLVTFLPLFRGVQFLDYAEYNRLTMKNMFLEQVRKAFYDDQFVRSFIRLMKKHKRLFIIEGLSFKKLPRIATMSQMAYIFISMHQLIINEKKNLWDTVNEVLGEKISSAYSIFLKKSLDGAGPRFGKPI